MKILYVIHSLPVGGAEKVAVDYLLELKNRGEEVALLEFSHSNSFLSEQLKQADIPVYTLLKTSLIERLRYRFFPSSYVSRFNRFITDIKPEAIHFQTIYRYMEKMNFPLSRCAFTFHARVDRAFNIGSWVKPLFERLSKTNLQFVAISSMVEKDIRALLSQAQIQMIPNGINISKIKEQMGQGACVREELGFNKDSFVLGQVGRFNKVKNHLHTIDVFNIIARRRDNAILVLVGSGSSDEEKVIKERIDSYHLHDKVRILGERRDSTRIMTCFDALIQPSFSESFSLVLIEAQACGVKCVASDAIPPEIICNKNCRQLSLNDSKEKWADAILDESIYEGSSNLSRFDINNVVNQLQCLYNSIIVK